MHLIIKPGGGNRTVVVMASTIRIWEAMRVPDFTRWPSKFDRNYDGASEGNSAESVVWRQLLEAEALDEKAEQGRATVLLDPVKCFERLTLWQAWMRCMWAGLPVRFLRMVMVTFSAARYLVVDGAWAGCADCGRDPCKQPLFIGNSALGALGPR